ncbi:MAG: gliding motility protein GldN [Chitinophagales bacterium]|nr:gliding motility protein GldN [Chitinophagales bacterium]MCZ2392685.1 gliding motility protein GldN [Chitinophagales bacterium]
MKNNFLKSLFTSTFGVVFVFGVHAQQPTMQVVDASEANTEKTEQTELQVLPWIQEVTGQRVVLDPDFVREADVFWKKEIWRVVDTREKMNLPFSYPKAPLINILIDAVKSGEVPVFGANDDDFKTPIKPEEALAMTGSTSDTVWVPDAMNPDILIPTVITKDFNFENVKQYRLKEMWYFNKQSSTMQVRILGIAPIMDDYSEEGVFRGTKALFWIYMPNLRNVLVKTEAFNPFPDGVRLTWDDIFTLRLFSSIIYKEDNVRDERVKDIWEDPIDQLYESERIKEKIFNFEHDLWEF